MRYDIQNLNFLRYPYGDEAIIGTLKVVAVLDQSMQVGSLVSHISHDQISVNAMKPYDSISEHFRIYRPDVLIISTDSVDFEWFIALTHELESELMYMPMLVNIAQKRTPELDRLAAKYQGFYFIKPPCDPAAQARHIEKFLITKVVTKEFYYKKVIECIKLTLRTMHCSPTAEGFEPLAETVLQVIVNPFKRFNFERDVYPSISNELKLTTEIIKTSIDKLIANALHQFTDAETSIAFDGNDLKNEMPSSAEFIHAAAFITSFPCRKILRNIEDEPFFKAGARIKYFKPTF